MTVFMLGNLSVEEMERKHSFTLSDEDRQVLKSMRQMQADVNRGDNVFHIFDIPRTILCGNMETAQKIYDILKKYTIHGQIQIAVA